MLVPLTSAGDTCTVRRGSRGVASLSEGPPCPTALPAVPPRADATFGGPRWADGPEFPAGPLRLAVQVQLAAAGGGDRRAQPDRFGLRDLRHVHPRYAGPREHGTCVLHSSCSSFPTFLSSSSWSCLVILLVLLIVLLVVLLNLLHLLHLAPRRLAPPAAALHHPGLKLNVPP